MTVIVFTALHYTYNIQTFDCDLDKENDQVSQSAPYIIVTGKPGQDENTVLYNVLRKPY